MGQLGYLNPKVIYTNFKYRLKEKPACARFPLSRRIDANSSEVCCSSSRNSVVVLSKASMVESTSWLGYCGGATMSMLSFP